MKEKIKQRKNNFFYVWLSYKKYQEKSNIIKIS